jgi:hypothetical protein
MIFNQKKIIFRNKNFNYISPINSIQTFYKTKDLFLSHDSSIYSSPNTKKVILSKSSENIKEKKKFINLKNLRTKSKYKSEKENIIQKILQKEIKLKIN